MPKRIHQPSLFQKKPHARLKANIVVKATPRNEPDLRLYGAALIALSEELKDKD